MRTWFHNIWQTLWTVLAGMRVTARTFFRTYRTQPFTKEFEYPEQPVPVAPRYRGFHRFDLTACIACDKCVRACPVDCIYLDKERNPLGKGFRVNGFKIDYGKCIFCALCVDPCPVECLFMGSSYDLSGYSRDGLIVDFAKLPLAVAWGQDTLNPSNVQESKKQTKPVWSKPAEPPKPAISPKPTA